MTWPRWKLSDMAMMIAGRLVMTTVERGLPATGLRVRKIDLISQVFQNVRHGDAHVRKHLIHDARDK